MAVVETERNGQVLIVRMNRPERLNALNAEMRQMLAEAWTEFRHSRALEVAIFALRLICLNGAVMEDGRQRKNHVGGSLGDGELAMEYMADETRQSIDKAFFLKLRDSCFGGSDLTGRVIVAGENFGCGSSRETGARVFLLAGVRAVVARSLARIFSRNVRNLGLPAVECPSLPALAPDALVELDLAHGRLSVPAAALDLPLTPLDPFWTAVLAAGGLLPFLGLGEPVATTKRGVSLPVYQGAR
jgi:3-isopropylmalate dehydratase small subunit